ncbi:MAG: hypothetical protein K2H01_05280 [Ruminococcus sp.]|nr:hypothetical protein [Ruminococcus sp.]
MNKKYKVPRSTVITLTILFLSALTLVFTAARMILNKSAFYIAAIILILIAIISVIYIPLSLSRVAIYINDNEIILKSGIIAVCERHMKVNRIELIYTISTPFSEYTGLNFSVLCVYGKRLVLPFMKKTDAEEIISILSKITNMEETSNEA